MILINLLPEQYRQKSRTPVRFLLAGAGIVAVNATLAAYWVWTAFGVAAQVDGELASLQDTQSGLAQQVVYHRSLEAESNTYDEREATLQAITFSRIGWTEKVDQLIDQVNRGGDREKYLVWFDDLNVEQKESKRNNSYGQFRAQGHSGSESFAHVANFLEDVEHSEFCQDFRRPAPPEGSQSSVDESLMPSVVVNFPLQLDLKSPEERHGLPAPTTAKPVKKPQTSAPDEKKEEGQ
jgi:hypothetical protein